MQEHGLLLCVCGGGGEAGDGGEAAPCCFETLNQVTCRTCNGRNSQRRGLKLLETISGLGSDVIKK